MAASMSSQGSSSWLNIDVDQEKLEDLAEEDAAASAETASCMIQSCSSAMTSTTCSNCSHSTRILSEAVHRKMEDIVRELSLQIQSLKNELKERQREEEGSLPREEVRSSSSSREMASGGNVEEVQTNASVNQEVQEQQQQEQEQEQHQQAGVEAEVGQQAQVTESSDAQKEASAENSPDQQVLYSNSFLPAQRTAPVFLPERERQASPPSSGHAPEQDPGHGNVRPSAPSPTPSMLSQRGAQSGVGVPPTPAMIVSTALSGPNLVVPQAHLPVTRTQPISGSILPSSIIARNYSHRPSGRCHEPVL